MITRNRDPLEISLQDAILKKLTKDAIKLIKMIGKRTSDATLNSVDDQGRSFLSYAIEENLMPVANLLLSLQAQEKDIIFGLDDNKRSLLWHAIKQTNIEMVKQLLTISASFPDLEKPLWLIADGQGNIPFHISAKVNHAEIMQLLLDASKNTKIPFSIINYTNQAGDTALHLSIQSHSYQAFIFLINHGALVLHNNDNKTSFDFLSELGTSQQLSIFRKMDDIYKDKLLKFYRNKLILSPDDAAIKNIYYQCCRIQSLQHLLASQLEFEDFPIKNFYTKTIRQSETNIPKQFSSISLDCPLPEIIFNRVPLYGQKVMEESAKLEIDLSQESHSLMKVIAAKSKNMLPTSDPLQVLDKDRVTLSNLIGDIENYVADLQRRRLVPIHNKVLSVIIPILYALAATGLIMGIYKAAEDNQLEHHHGKELHKTWSPTFIMLFIMTCMSSVFGAIATVYYGSNYFFEKKAVISKKEWQKLLDDLQINVLDNLHELQKRSDATISYLPTDMLTINEVETEMAALKKNQNIPSAIAIFSRLKNIIKDLQKDMNKSNKSLSLFAPRDSLLDIIEENQEHTPLVSSFLSK